MGYDFYSILHLSSLFLLIFSLGGLWAFYQTNRQDKYIKKFLMILHGLSLFFIFLAGFGLIAKLKIPTPWPLWAYIKIGLWLLLGCSPILLKKKWPLISCKKTQSFLSFILLFFLIVMAVVTIRLKY